MICSMSNITYIPLLLTAYSKLRKYRSQTLSEKNLCKLKQSFHFNVIPGYEQRCNVRHAHMLDEYESKYSGG